MAASRPIIGRRRRTTITSFQTSIIQHVYLKALGAGRPQRLEGESGRGEVAVPGRKGRLRTASSNPSRRPTMIFTTIGANVDHFLARTVAFARGAYEFRRDITRADPARSECNSYTELDETYDHGRTLAHRVSRRRFDGLQLPGSVTLIRIPDEEPAPHGSTIRPLGPSNVFPLTLICEGRVQYPEDHSYGTYWVGHTLQLGEHHHIKDAILAAARILARGSFCLDDDEALGFSPDLFVIRDQVQRLVLAGEPWGQGIKWCEPVASDDEIARLRAEIEQTCREASFEAGWDNHETAQQLRRRASVLKGHLVDIAWRARARNALAATGAWRSPCPAPSDPLPVPSYTAQRA